MRRGLAVIFVACLACGVSPKMPVSGETLQHDDLINREMCVQMTEWIFQLFENEIAAEQYEARAKLRELRAQATADKEIASCTENIVKSRYLCVMAARKTWQAQACEREGVAAPALPATLRPLDERWIEIASEHFLVWTDLPSDQAAALVRRIEDVRAAMLVVFYDNAEAKVRRSRVIAPGTLNEWRRFAGGSDVLGVAYPSTVSPFREALLLVSPGAGGVDAGTVATHELVHHLTSTMIRDLPRWFAEGLATYFETVQIDRAAGTAVIGKVPERVSRTLASGGGARLKPLVAGSLDHNLKHPYGDDFYASSYLLTAYLFAQQDKELVTYQRLLKQVGHEGHMRAWQAAFPTLQPDTMEPGIARWWLSGGHVPYQVKLPAAPPVSLTQRALSPADAYTTRALLYLLASDGHNLDDALLNLEAAVGEDPQHVLANTITVAVKGAALDVEIARTIVRAHPDDWMAHALLMAALPEGSAERAAARAEVCKRIAADPVVTLPEDMCAP